MEMIREMKNQCREVIKKASALPLELKQHCVYEEGKDGQKIYLDAYIPFIGEKYGQVTKILFYCTAQNLANRNASVRREYADNPEMAIERLQLRKAGTLNIDIGPVSGGVLPALAGVMLFLKNDIWEEDLANVLQYISVTNFYKFSLWDSKKNDLHPGKLRKNEREKYDKFMFENYVRDEIEILKPDYIFAFSTGYDPILSFLKQKPLPIELFLIHDPAFILHGGGKKAFVRDWEIPLPDKKVEKLIEAYGRYIKEKAKTKDPDFYSQYGGRVEQIKGYLRHYYQLIRKKLYTDSHG